MIEALGEIARLATTILEAVKKKPLTSLEQLNQRIEAEENCTDIIQTIDKLEKEGKHDEAVKTFHSFVDNLLKF